MAGLVFIGIFVFSAVVAAGAFLFGHDVDHDPSGLHDGDHAGHMPGIFSPRVIAMFLLGFSGLGAVATYAWNWSVGGASLCGLGGGIVMAGITMAMMAFFTSQEASSAVAASDYVGLSARVASAIPAKGTGEISVNVRGQLRSIFATAADGAAVPAGRAVKIQSIAAGVATVTPE